MASTSPIKLSSTGATAIVLPAQGATILSFAHRATGAEALWHRARHVPAPCTRDLGPAADGETSFLDRWAGGWFPMFPLVGHTAADSPAALLHGELVRLPWDVLARDDNSVTLHVRTVRSPFAVTRTVALEGATLTVAQRIENAGAEPAEYLSGEHPCFARATFAGGRIALDAHDGARVPHPPYDPAHARLATPQAITWPHAGAAGGGGAPVDLAEIPRRADGTQDHVELALASPRVTLTAPLHALALDLDVDLGAHPALLLWHDFGATRGFPYFGDADTFALEPSTNPHRTVAEARAAGAFRTLAPGDHVAEHTRLTWRTAPAVTA
jgi:galactose mutarotase-like enzyme